MKNRLFRSVIFFSFLFFSCSLAAQKPAKSNTDNNSRHNKGNSAIASEFRYILYLDSMLRVNQGLTSDTVNVDQGQNVSGSKSGANSNLKNIMSSPGFSLFFQVLAIIFIVFLVYKLVLKNLLFSHRKNKHSSGNNENEELADIDAGEYKSLVSKAASNEQFNLAIKYYFLQVLRKLNDYGLIEYSTDKTNQYYINEIKPVSKQKEFENLAHIYEYAWYGKYDINKIQYQHFEKEFTHFLSTIN